MSVSARDIERSHFLPLDSLEAMTPSFDWKGYLERRLVRVDSLNVAQPGFFRGLEATLTSTPLADWQDYLRWRVLEDAAPMLTQAFADEDFRWSSVLSGAKEMQPRWKRCVRATDGDLGDLLGKAYVKEAFPPAAKARALRMVENLEAALDERIGQLDWMSGATKQAARAKLHAFGNKIGYPDRWRDYAGVTIGRTSAYANHRACSVAETARLTAQIGKPTDRGEWRMTAPTVNAFYSPTLNTINFPAGILQPPFYDDAWDDAVNYGAIGAVIGHEMSHGFDDQGRKFDAHGNLRDWWTAEDAANYRQRSEKVEAQYSEYTVLDSLHVNGRLTLGENTADIGGLAIAFAALQRELKGKPAPGLIQGFTPEQRFFLAYARIWRRVDRDEALRRQVLTNPHSPAHWRVNGPLSDLDEFEKAFGCKDGDAMVREAAKRARIW
ncbi:MAG: M13 family metallopeptidase [Candidatus Eisenbacteria bacterium]|nr:M13 family metallopeptidase [Candidatus Eisenbacteria bacterium]